MDKEDNVAEHGMIDISEKPYQKREAVAEGRIYLSEESLHHIRTKTNPKGDVLENAKLSAILAVKKTPDLVFMCHPISINSVKVFFTVEDTSVHCSVKVVAKERTGVEIEAMAGVMNALLSIFDLSKRFEKDISGNYPAVNITDLKVTHKAKSDLIKEVKS